MFRTITTISSLLTGIGILVMGHALLSTILGIRAVNEGFADSVTGAVMTSYFGGFIVGTFLLPNQIERIGHIRTFAALAAIGAVCTFVHTLWVNPLAWAVLRFMVGFCMVGIYMVLESWLNRSVTNEIRGGVFSTYMIVTLGALSAGQYLLLIDPEARALAFGLAAALFSLGLVPIALTRLPQPTHVTTPSMRLRALFRLSPFSTVGTFAASFATNAFWALGAVFATRRNLNPADIALLMSLTIGGGVLFQWPLGRLSDFIDRRIVLVASSIITALIALFLAIKKPGNTSLLFTTMFVMGGFMYPMYSICVALLNDHVSSEHAVETSRSILLIHGIGAVAGPVIAGIAMQFLGPDGLFYHIAATFIVLVLFGTFRLAVSSPVPAEQKAEFLAATRTSQIAIDVDPRFNTESSDKNRKQAPDIPD
jgi:MFS family permease